jgi:DNA-binding transcriptional ArsR family regulator
MSWAHEGNDPELNSFIQNNARGEGGEKPASELAEAFGVSFAAISQHLKILKEANLVVERREGRQRIYQLHPKPLREK